MAELDQFARPVMGRSAGLKTIKTQYRPQWIWASFEHVDNVPPIGVGEAREPDARDANAPYSYNDFAKQQSEGAPPIGSVLAQPVSPDNPPRIDPAPTQVIRKHPINRETMAMNRAYWALPGIRGTVWANYMLVTTQWPTVTQPPTPDNDGRYFPGLRLEPGAPAEPYQTGERQPKFRQRHDGNLCTGRAGKLHGVSSRRFQHAGARFCRDSDRRQLSGRARRQTDRGRAAKVTGRLARDLDAGSDESSTLSGKPNGCNMKRR
jgi:hypothetical protein